MVLLNAKDGTKETAVHMYDGRVNVWKRMWRSSAPYGEIDRTGCQTRRGSRMCVWGCVDAFRHPTSI